MPRMSLLGNRHVAAVLLAAGLVCAAIVAVQSVAAELGIPVRFGEDEQCRDQPAGAGEWIDYVQTALPPQATCIYANQTVEFVAREELARIGAIAIVAVVLLVAASVFLAARLRAFPAAVPAPGARLLLLAVAIVAALSMAGVGHAMVTGAVGPVTQSQR